MNADVTIAMTQVQFDANAVRLKQQSGIEVGGKSGQIVQNGAIVHWQFDGANVTASVMRIPPYGQRADVVAKVKGWFKA
jgi:hypothetical protein